MILHSTLAGTRVNSSLDKKILDFTLPTSSNSSSKLQIFSLCTSSPCNFLTYLLFFSSFFMNTWWLSVMMHEENLKVFFFHLLKFSSWCRLHHDPSHTSYIYISLLFLAIFTCIHSSIMRYCAINFPHPEHKCLHVFNFWEDKFDEIICANKGVMWKWIFGGKIGIYSHLQKNHT